MFEKFLFRHSEFLLLHSTLDGDDMVEDFSQENILLAAETVDVDENALNRSQKNED